MTLLDRAEARLAALLKLPEQAPEAPPGSGQVQLFRAAPRYLAFNLVRWGVSQGFALLGLGIGVAFVSAVPAVLWPVHLAEAIGIAFYLAQLPLSLGAVWLDYNRRWYLVTDRSLRIREGVWTVHERTMSFANVQNLEVRQGPIDRLLGIASLEVRSAGGGQGHGGGGQGGSIRRDLHVAYFRGVDNAREIRDLILARLRRWRGAGLGDTDEEELGTGALAAAPALGAPRSGDGASAAALAAARELLAEARALRRAIAAGE